MLSMCPLRFFSFLTDSGARGDNILVPATGSEEEQEEQ